MGHQQAQRATPALSGYKQGRAFVWDSWRRRRLRKGCGGPLSGTWPQEETVSESTLIGLHKGERTVLLTVIVLLILAVATGTRLRIRWQSNVGMVQISRCLHGSNKLLLPGLVVLYPSVANRTNANNVGLPCLVQAELYPSDLRNAQGQLDPLAWYNAGQLAMLGGDHTSALYAYTKAVSNAGEGGFERAVLAVGNVYETLGHHGVAMDNWAKVPKLAAGANYYLGNHFRQAQRWDEAIRRYQIAISLGGGTAYEFLGLQSMAEVYLYGLRSAAQSIMCLQRAIKLQPDNISVRLLLIRALIDAQEYNDAIDEAFNLMNRYPTSAPYVYELLGLAYYRSGDLAKAEEAYKRSLGVGNENVWVYYTLGLIYADWGRKDEAYLYWQKALELDPTFEWAKRDLHQQGR